MLLAIACSPLVAMGSALLATLYLIALPIVGFFVIRWVLRLVFGAWEAVRSW